jgi:hypothetical protein
MSQRTALNRDQMTLERALRSSGYPQPNARRDDGGLWAPPEQSPGWAG